MRLKTKPTARFARLCDPEDTERRYQAESRASRALRGTPSVLPPNWLLAGALIVGLLAGAAISAPGKFIPCKGCDVCATAGC